MKVMPPGSCVSRRQYARGNCCSAWLSVVQVSWPVGACENQRVWWSRESRVETEAAEGGFPRGGAAHALRWLAVGVGVV